MNNQYGYYNNVPNNGYYPPQNGYYPQSNVVMNNQVEKPKKKKIWIIILIIIIVLVVATFLVWKLSSSKGKDYTFEMLQDTTAFFLPNDDDYYALFNEQGKRLTEFTFDRVGDFYGGVALVKKEDGTSAIIKEDGSYLLDFTEDTITDYHTLFLIKEKDGNMKLMNYKGKKLLEGNGISVSDFNDASLFLVSMKDEKTVKVMNYKGDILEEVEVGTYSKSPNVVNGFVSLIGGKKTSLYDLDSGKKVYETKGSYCVTKSDSNITILSSCASPDNIKKHLVLKDNQEIYSVSKSACSTLNIMKDGNVICKTSNSNIYRFLNDNGSLKDEIVASYHNRNDYVVKNGSGLIFYVDGNERYRISCVNVENNTENGYIIKNYTYGECTDNEVGIYYYNKIGEKISNSLYDATDWDSNGLAIAANKANSYYFMNDKLEKLSKDYYSITGVDSLYVVMEENGNYILLDAKQNGIEQGFSKYKTLERSTSKGNILALIYDSKISLYNSSSGNKIGEGNGTNVILYEHYYRIDDAYYSYLTGQQFYEIE